MLSYRLLLCRGKLSYTLPHRRITLKSLSQMRATRQFVQRRNPLSGVMEWFAEETDYDYCREIARSSYADMLHDTERNKMYYEAIKLAVQEMHQRGKKAKVLDIGTGTGLLSMMAASAGAEQITAIEVFAPMARVARQITKKNGFDFINVINKHSTEVEMGKDMKERANILVTELFDTELIGEGALVAYHHAHQNLMEEESISVPHSASTYIQLVESKVMHSWHVLNPIKIQHDNGEEDIIEPDPAMKDCPGVPAVHDIQLSQIKRDQFKEITGAVKVFQFDWNSKALSPTPIKRIVKTKATSSGTAQVLLSWWTLNMDTKGDILLSTAPYWFHPTPNTMQWRDHWMQSVYFLPRSFQADQGSDIFIAANHDTYSMWFDASTQKTKEMISDNIEHPVCNYLPRMLWSRPRLAMLNNESRNKCLVDVLKTVDFGQKNHTTVCVSDVSLLPIFVGCFSRNHIYSLESSRIAQRGIQNLVSHNRLSGRVTVLNLESYELPIEESVNLLIGEPFFNKSLLPWFDLEFWHVRTTLNKFLSPEARIVPAKARLCLVAVEFEDLWKIRDPIGNVEGFDVSIMDEMIDEAMETEDYHEPEPHALWEYPNTLLSSPQSVCEFDFTKPLPPDNVEVSGHIQLLPDAGGTCHGIVLWMEYELNKGNVLSTGLNNHSIWNMNYKQGVFFLRKPVSVTADRNIRYEIWFTPQTNAVRMKFTAGTIE